MLAPGLVLGNSRPNGPASGSGDSFNQPLTPAQRSAVSAALREITPPAGFHEYLHWSVTRAKAQPSVPCTPTTGICFASDELLQPLSSARAGELITQFGVHVQEISCEGLLLNSCAAQGTFSRYHLGIVVEVIHAVQPTERSGTQVTFYGGPHQ